MLPPYARSDPYPHEWKHPALNKDYGRTHSTHRVDEDDDGDDDTLVDGSESDNEDLDADDAEALRAAFGYLIPFF